MDLNVTLLKTKAKNTKTIAMIVIYYYNYVEYVDGN